MTEEVILDMNVPFFNSVLTTLGKRVNYDAVVNFAGNAFAKDSWKMIQEANPLLKQKKIGAGFIDLLNKASTTKSIDDLGDISWAT